MRLCGFAWLLAAAGSTAVAAPLSYTVDPTHTSVYFAASHFDRTTVRGRFGKIDGRIVYDPDTGAGGIDFTVETSSSTPATEASMACFVRHSSWMPPIHPWRGSGPTASSSRTASSWPWKAS